jgi:hypothetical protein
VIKNRATNKLETSFETSSVPLNTTDQDTEGHVLENPPILAITDFLDTAALELTEAITSAAKASIPVSKPGARPKPWWLLDLKDIRQDMLRKQRLVDLSDPESTQRYLQARNIYFQAIKQAKRDHWNAFLEKEDPKSIFKAMLYTKNKRIEPITPIQSTDGEYIDDFQGKAITFRNTLFPTPPSIEPPDWDNYEPGEWTWPYFSEIELSKTYSAKIKGTTPGSDYITQIIITKAYQVIPDHFL